VVIGGAVRIRVVRIRPMPPCCMACLVSPLLDAPSSRKGVSYQLQRFYAECRAICGFSGVLQLATL
jgi:hypothetical protein